MNQSHRERVGANNTPRVSYTTPTTNRVTRNPDVEPAVLPFKPTKKAAGDVVIGGAHRQADRASGPADLSRCASQPKALIPCAWRSDTGLFARVASAVRREREEGEAA